MIRVNITRYTSKTRSTFPTCQSAFYHHNTGPSKQKTILLRKTEHDQQRSSKTVQHDKRTNTPRMYTLPRSTRYRKQIAALDLLSNTVKLIKTVKFNLTQEEQEID